MDGDFSKKNYHLNKTLLILAIINIVLSVVITANGTINTLNILGLLHVDSESARNIESTTDFS